MRQQTLADGSFEKFRKKNRKELFLDDMEQIIPWQDLCGVIEPYYPKPEGAGRGPVGIERKLPFPDWTLEGDYRPNPVII